MATPTPFIIGEAMRRAAQWFKEHPDRWTRQVYSTDLMGHVFENISMIPEAMEPFMCYCAAGRVGKELLEMGFPWRHDRPGVVAERQSLINLVESASMEVVPRFHGAHNRFMSDFNDAQTSPQPVIRWMEEAADKLQGGP